MSRLQPVDPASADVETQEILEQVERGMGKVPNLVSVMAHSPHATRAYLAFNQELSEGRLPRQLREKLALVVGQSNGCDYCVAAHTTLGQALGMSQSETLKARNGLSEDPREQTALQFAKSVVEKRGVVSDREFSELRSAGYDQGEIIELIAHVALNMFTNYFNHLAETELDFPAPASLTSSA